ncbi:Bifunctional F420 biosynthesis protein FbiB [Porphyromonas levii]|nr:Bifunctional F420 biosynthesis protein FbiB [Porphyromonas levii]MBR8714755.1 Bifunctional F420 biosynthesis protein FbiB [Porphyromonas levii]MBR8727281.1 Bifunctional F420 biosynthesis protein FbiB [Porphyromonas levii]MBR8735616.1 Bifunctional F420 biosynthesis protein FbiB [Porphyromonas levii]MBR8765698.1 Bifunctional F420 biosynthesis protein FbiB [Porphyromonas levii]
MFSHTTFLTRKRRSVRQYTDERIKPDVLQDILEAGLRAPTSKNSRSTRFIVVEDKAMLQELSACKKHGGAFVAEAALAIVVCSDSEKSARPYSDCAIAASFMQLAVTDHDLGSCWCHVEDTLAPTGTTAEAYVRERLGLPERFKVLCILGIGEVAEADMLKPRDRELEWERTYVEQYEEREE